jgi:hypothetical protein
VEPNERAETDESVEPSERAESDDLAREHVSPPAPTVTTTAPPSATAASTALGPRRKALAIVAGEMAAAALIAGAILVGAAEAQRSALLARMPYDAAGNPECARPGLGGATSTLCDGLRSTGASANRLRNAGIGFFAGGVGLAAGAAYLLWPSWGEPAKAPSHVIPVAGSDGGGLVWTGTF